MAPMSNTNQIVTVPQAIQLALQHHQEGRLPQAEVIYRQVLQVDPGNSDALHLLGVVCFQAGKYEIAIEFISKAINANTAEPLYYNNIGEAYRALNRLDEAFSCYQNALSLKPDYAEAHNNLGNAFQTQGNLDEAFSCYQRALLLRPDYAEAHCNLGVIYKDRGDFDAAYACYQAALSLRPNIPEAHNNLGNIYESRGNLNEALACYQRALSLKPDYAEAHNNQGNVFQAQGNLGEAFSCYQKALSLKPDYTEAHNSLGNVYKDQGNLDAAFSCYQQALSLKPDYAAAHCNLGVIHKDRGNLDAALSFYRKALSLKPNFVEAHVNMGNVFKDRGHLGEALACYQRALSLKPDYAVAYINIGVIYNEQAKFDEAVACYQRALSLKPDYAEAHGNLGNSLKNQDRIDEAVVCYQRALSLRPDYVEAHNNLGNAFKDQCRLAEAIACYRKALSFKPEYAEAQSNLLLALQYVPDLTGAELFAEAVAYGLRFEEPLKNEREKQLGNVPNPANRLKVGLVSGDLRSHSVGYFLASVLQHIDSKTVILYAYANQFVHDSLSERIRPYFEGWIEVKGLTDDELAEQIRADRIDILIDLSGHTDGNRLPVFARKPAPIQVTWLGYPNTTGMEGMDYILADSTTVPVDEERFYTEKVWRLPETSLCFTPPEIGAEVGGLPALKNGYITLGCFNNLAKLNDRVLVCWADILQSVPNSVLLLKSKSFGAKGLRDDFQQRFDRLGIGAERLHLEGYLSREKHFEAYKLVDFALDPFPFPGVTTTCEALWMGVPTLTMSTPRGIIGHNGELIMGLVGLSEWVATSTEEYVGKALEFTENIDKLVALRAGLRQTLLGSPLCNARRFAGHLESAFHGMVKTLS